MNDSDEDFRQRLEGRLNENPDWRAFRPTGRPRTPVIPFPRTDGKPNTEFIPRLHLPSPPIVENHDARYALIARVLRENDLEFLRKNGMHDQIQRVHRANCRYYQTAIRVLWREFYRSITLRNKSGEYDLAKSMMEYWTVAFAFMALALAGIALYLQMFRLAQFLASDKLRTVQAQIEAARSVQAIPD